MKLPFALNRRNLIIAAICILILIVIAITANLTQSFGKQLVSAPFATNFTYPKQISSQTIYYFSGSAFVSYDLTTHKTTPLTPIYSMPSVVNQVVWSKQGAIFNASGYTSVDQLYTILVQKSLSPNRYYWWSVDFKTGAISLIGDPASGADVRGAAWQTDTGFVYAEQPTGKDTLTILQSSLTPTTPPKAAGTLPADAIIRGATSSTALYTQPNNTAEKLVSLNLASKQTTDLIPNLLSLLAASPDGSVLAITEAKKPYAPEVPRGPLVLHNQASKKTTIISSNFRGLGVWGPTSDQWFVLGLDTNNTPTGFTLAGGKTTQFGLQIKNGQQAANHLTPIGQAAAGLVVTDTTRQVHLLSAKAVTNLPALPDYSAIQTDTYQPTFDLNYIRAQDQYSVYISQNPYQANVQAVLHYLTDRHYDPYQLRLKWYAYDEVTTGFGLPPDLTPIEEPEQLVPATESLGD